MRQTKRWLHFGATIAACGVACATARGDALTLWNGVDGPGSLRVTTDDYGSFGVALGWPDLFDPSPDSLEGSLPEGSPTHVTHLFAFVDPSPIGNGTHRGVLSTSPVLLDLFSDGNLVGTVTSPNTLIDAQSATSAFVVAGDGVEIQFVLTQTVSALPVAPAGQTRALLEQTYVMTNLTSDPVELIIVKNLDQDLNFGGAGGLDDLVGADFAELGRPQVFAQDSELTVAALVLRTRDNHSPSFPDVVPNSVDSVYCAAKQFLNAFENPNYPGGACPAYDEGDVTEIWDNFGLPNCWKNNVPGVGHDVPGASPQLLGDAFMGLQIEADLHPGIPYEFSFHTLYGFRPPPDTQDPPFLDAHTVQLDPDTGCAEFLWTVTNENPLVIGEDFVHIETFFLDIEAGDGGDSPCVFITPPDGWSDELCASDSNGHSLYSFTGGTPIADGETVHGRLVINTNGAQATTDPITMIEVPPHSVVLHAAQEQIDPVTHLPLACDFNFGPTRAGEWSDPVTATAFLPVPSMTVWAEATLAVVLMILGTLAIARCTFRGSQLRDAVPHVEWKG